MKRVICTLFVLLSSFLVSAQNLPPIRVKHPVLYQYWQYGGKTEMELQVQKNAKVEIIVDCNYTDYQCVFAPIDQYGTQLNFVDGNFGTGTQQQYFMYWPTYTGTAKLTILSLRIGDRYEFNFTAVRYTTLP